LQRAPALSLLSFIATLLVLSFATGCSTQDAETTECWPTDGWGSAPFSATADTDEGPPLEPIPGSLADNLYWQPVPAEADPFWSDADPEVEICPDAQWAAETEHEGVWFTVETTLCGYLTVGQPLLMDLKKGQKVRVRIWHFTITVGEGEAKLRVAMGCDAETVWEASMEIPTEKGGLVMDTWTAPRDFAAGEPIYYNVSNHGSNSWGLIELAVFEE